MRNIDNMTDDEYETYVIFKINRIRITPQREAVFKMFLKYLSPISYEDLQIELKGVLDQVTLYRTLTFFLKKGILRIIERRNNIDYFGRTRKNLHYVRCSKCDLVEGFRNRRFDIYLKEIANKLHENMPIVHEFSLNLFGLCAKCRD